MPSVPFILLRRAPLRVPIPSRGHYIFAPPLISVPLISRLPRRPAPAPMPVSPLFRRDHDDDGLAIALAASDMSLADSSPFLSSFDDMHAFDSDAGHMIFQFDDSVSYESKQPMAWDPSQHDYPLSPSASYLPGSPESTSSQLDFGAPIAHLPPSARSHYALSSFADVAHQQQPDFYSQWLADADATLHPPSSSSSPIDIPLAHSHSSAASSLQAFSDNSSIFPDVSPFSPNTAYAALQPLPRSFSPGEEDFAHRALQGNPGLSTSPSEPPLSPPVWASQLWTPPNATQPLPTTPSSTLPHTPDSEDAYATQRPRMALRRNFAPVSDLFPSSSAPSVSHIRPPMSRSYSRRAESISEHDDATVRRKKRSLVQGDEEHRPVERIAGDGEYLGSSSHAVSNVPFSRAAPMKSSLRPPKLAPSAWQLYFTDWIQRHQATSPKKLNVAQAAKEAGQEYARLSAEEKEVGIDALSLSGFSH